MNWNKISLGKYSPFKKFKYMIYLSPLAVSLHIVLQMVIRKLHFVVLRGQGQTCTYILGLPYSILAWITRLRPGFLKN